MRELQRAVLLVLGLAVGVSLIIGVLSNPQLLKLAVPVASGLGAIAAALYGWSGRFR
jgi:hypothetical protein